MEAVIVDNGEDALQHGLERIPEGAEVHSLKAFWDVVEQRLTLVRPMACVRSCA